MGRRTKARKKFLIEKQESCSEQSENGGEATAEELPTDDVPKPSIEAEETKATPVQMRSRLPVPCVSGLVNRLSSAKTPVVFQTLISEDSPDCKRSMIPRLLPVRVTRPRQNVTLKTDEYDDDKRIAQEA